MNRTERFTRESDSTTGANVISTIFIVGITALIFAQTALLPGDEGLAAVAAREAPRDVGTVFTLSREEADAAARSARQDDPPIASF